MEDIYYLVHTTNNPNYNTWEYLKTTPFNTDDQFPGVYFSIITKYNIDNEFIYPGKYILIFSKKLLYQNNYHINFTDYNGIISENNTYIPWNLNNFINKVKENEGNKTFNEVVFHDNIDMKYLCLTLQKIPGQKINQILPREIIENDISPDLSKKPFYCYPFEDIYTGSDPQPRSPKKWFEMMANVCNIKINQDDNDEEIVDKIKKKSLELYNNRDLQNIKLLKEYTNNNSFGGDNKIIKNKKITKSKKNSKKKSKKKTNKKLYKKNKSKNIKK